MSCLVEELSNAEQQGSLSRPIQTWKEIRDLPYLDVCVLEALRIHPPFALPFERVVPDEGVKLGDTYLSGGTVVGMSPYVVNRHRETFGNDPDQWQPERWLKLDLDQRRKREHSLLTVCDRLTLYPWFSLAHVRISSSEPDVESVWERTLRPWK